MKSSILKVVTAGVTATATALALAGVTPALAANPAAPEPSLTLATSRHTEGAEAARDRARQHRLSVREKVELLRHRVKYVFVLFQENRSFDHYFGTYPGANGLFSTYPGANPADAYAQPATSFGSFHSVIRDTDGSYTTISPFLIPRTIVNASGATVQLYPEDTYSVDHSHVGYLHDMHADQATRSRR